MRFPKQIFFLTFVLGTSVCLAAPHELNPGSGEISSDSESSAAKTAEKLETVTVTDSPDTGPKKTVLVGDAYFYRYQSSLSPRLGYVFNPEWSGTNYLFGFTYMADSLTHRHWEIGADMYSNSKGIFQGGVRWIFSPSSPFRPFVKASLGILMEPSDGLGNLLTFSHYQARFAGGFEKLLRDPMSLRVDLELAAGSGGFMGAAIVGYSWAW